MIQPSANCCQEVEVDFFKIKKYT